MPRRYPPLTPKQVCKNLKSLGFEHTGNYGDHRIYEDEAGHHVQVDMGEKDFGPRGMKIIIGNSGFSREQFYGATKMTARKLEVPHRKLKKKKPSP